MGKTILWLRAYLLRRPSGFQSMEQGCGIAGNSAYG
jgi:hypothetical protein